MLSEKRWFGWNSVTTPDEHLVGPRALRVELKEKYVESDYQSQISSVVRLATNAKYKRLSGTFSSS